MKRWVLAAVAGAACGTGPVAVADHIWERRDPRYAYLFQDNRARAVGDIVTVLIAENTVANEQDQRALTRNSNADATLTFGKTADTPGQLFGTAGNRKFAGNATMTTNRTFTDRIAATVVDILPNGNLVIEGYRSRVVAGEERVLRITGVIRQQDVAVGSTILSTQVANFRIGYLGRGPASRTANQGIVGRFFNLIQP
jgi:flagellar L-ring protein precursor FlgH